MPKYTSRSPRPGGGWRYKYPTRPGTALVAPGHTLRYSHDQTGYGGAARVHGFTLSRSGPRERRLSLQFAGRGGMTVGGPYSMRAQVTAAGGNVRSKFSSSGYPILRPFRFYTPTRSSLGRLSRLAGRV
jgi:hypothetical protein